MHPLVNKKSCLLWNYDEVLPLLQENKNVKACFYGHYHSGGYHYDETGLHHIVIASPLECLNDDVAYAIVEVYDDYIDIKGEGKIKKMKLSLR